MTGNRHKWILIVFTAAVLLGPLAAEALAQGARGKQTATSRSSREEKLLGRTSSDENRIIDRNGGGGGGWWQTALALLLVVGLIFLARYLLRRLGGRAVKTGGGAVDVLARTSVSPRQQLLLVRLGQRLLLVGSGPEGMTPLSEITDPQEVERMVKLIETSKAESFAEILRRKAAAIRPGRGGRNSREEGE